MTAEEKARELVEKFTPLVHQGGMVDMTTVEREMDNAKDCALIAVDEIIEQEKEFHCYNPRVDYYWQDVRKAIELI